MAITQKKKEEIKQRIDELSQVALNKIKSYKKDSNELLKALNFMSDFTINRYTSRNQDLIQSQFSGSMVVASASDWKSKGYLIKKGETSIRILTPKKASALKDPETNELRFYKDWTKEERKAVRNKELKPMEVVVGFYPAPVFDIAQTTVPPEDYPKLFLNAPQLYHFKDTETVKALGNTMVSIANERNIPISMQKVRGTEKGYYAEGHVGDQVIKRIVLNSRYDESEQLTVLIHEVAHSLLHSSKDSIQEAEQLTTPEKELQAEMTAYVVMNAFHLGYEENSIAYMSNWTKNLERIDDKKLRELMNGVASASQMMIERTMQYMNDEDLLIDKTPEEIQELIQDSHLYKGEELEKHYVSTPLEEWEEPKEDKYVSLYHYDMILKNYVYDRAKDGQGYSIEIINQAGDSKDVSVSYDLKKGICDINYYDPEKYELVPLRYQKEVIEYLIQEKLLPFETYDDYLRMKDEVSRGIYKYDLDYSFLEDFSDEEKVKFMNLSSKTQIDGQLETPYLTIEFSEDPRIDKHIYTLDEFDELLGNLYEDEEDSIDKAYVRLHTTPNYYEELRFDLGQFPSIDSYLPEKFVEYRETLEDLQEEVKKNPYSVEVYDHYNVKTQFKNRSFDYHIYFDEVTQDLKGYFIRDFDKPRPAKIEACQAALEYLQKSLPSSSQEEKEKLGMILQKTYDNQTKQEIYKEKLDELNLKYHLTRKTQYPNQKFMQKVEYAKSVNILEVAQRAGITLHRDSANQYRDANNRSMVFTVNKNNFYENNGQFGGDPIEFVRKVVGIDDFKQAVDWINEGDYSTIDLSKVEQQSHQPYEYDSSKESASFQQAKNYLVNERKIDPNLVDWLHEQGNIVQDQRNNVVFLWKDENNHIVGASEQGTVKMKKSFNGRTHWKSIQRNSTSGYGFNFTNGQPKHLKVFESSIDAMSYATLHGLEKDTMYLSMDGLKENVMMETYKHLIEDKNISVESIVICTDNDEAGQEFASFAERIPAFNFVNKETNEPFKTVVSTDLPTTQKDWNEVLQKDQLPLPVIEIQKEELVEEVQKEVNEPTQIPPKEQNYKQYEVNSYSVEQQGKMYIRHYEENIGVYDTYEEATTAFYQEKQKIPNNHSLAVETVTFDNLQDYQRQMNGESKIYGEVVAHNGNLVGLLNPPANLTEEMIHELDPDILEAVLPSYSNDEVIENAFELRNEVIQEVPIPLELATQLEERKLMKVCPSYLLLEWEKDGNRVGYSQYDKQTKEWVHHGKEPNTLQLSFGEPKHLRGFKDPNELFCYLEVNGWEQDTQYIVTNDNESVITHYQQQKGIEDTIIYSDRADLKIDNELELEVYPNSFKEQAKKKRKQEQNQQMYRQNNENLER